VDQDFRVAWRFLKKSPLSTGLAVLTLGLTLGLFGIGVAVIDDTFSGPAP
jgi:hypothetical protein